MEREREREKDLLRNSKKGGNDVRDLKFIGNEWIHCRREGKEQRDVDEKEEEDIVWNFFGFPKKINYANSG